MSIYVQIHVQLSQIRISISAKGEKEEEVEEEEDGTEEQEEEDEEEDDAEEGGQLYGDVMEMLSLELSPFYLLKKRKLYEVHKEIM